LKRAVFAALIALPAVLFVSPSHSPGTSCLADNPDAVRNPPWIQAPKFTEDQTLALPSLAEKTQAQAPDRFTGLWASEDESGKHIDVAMVTPSDSDLQELGSLLKQSAEFSDFDIQLFPVPYANVKLLSIYDEFGAMLDARSKDDAPLNAVESVSIRADLGAVLIRVDGDPQLLESRLAGALPDCSTVVVDEPLEFQTLISRTDMPPYKGGKRQRVVLAAGENPATCETGFVFELDGGGHQPLRVASAGHCSQRDQDNQPVYDGNTLIVQVGTTIPPNMFRNNSPADGDAFYWKDYQGSRSDFQNTIILNSSEQRNVVAKISSPSTIQPPMSICNSTISNDVICGYITDGYPTRLQSVKYRDYFQHSDEEKDITNMACSNAAAYGGDSGGPVFQWNGQNGATAVGITSTAIQDRVTHEILGSCFTPVAWVETKLGGHVWFGD
jgi:hypothetical protein